MVITVRTMDTKECNSKICDSCRCTLLPLPLSLALLLFFPGFQRLLFFRRVLFLAFGWLSFIPLSLVIIARALNFLRHGSFDTVACTAELKFEFAIVEIDFGYNDCY